MHVKVRGIGLIIFVCVVSTLHGNGGLYLSALVPLVEAGDGDHLCRGRHRCPPGGLVVEPLPPGVGVPGVPGPHPGVHVAGAHARDEQKRLLEGVAGKRFPIFPARPVRKSIGSKICVEPVKPRGLDVEPVLVLHHQSYEDGIQVRVPDGDVPAGAEHLLPLLHGHAVGVVDIKQRQLTGSPLHFVVSRVCPVLRVHVVQILPKIGRISPLVRLHMQTHLQTLFLSSIKEDRNHGVSRKTIFICQAWRVPGHGDNSNLGLCHHLHVSRDDCLVTGAVRAQLWVEVSSNVQGRLVSPGRIDVVIILVPGRDVGVVPVPPGPVHFGAAVPGIIKCVYVGIYAIFTLQFDIC